ncbi:dihydroorotate dehydrogenase electron transfer subunit [Azorhizobium oxalatiphilum]|uniref:dihydroorotate dehydrogenase electron transfer subunit n=1 Tax=Azorhizobium oxalatiphilum TaxID=980631 RepID=UPI001FCE3D5C|nr:dihydroorotate dehydrogenase electron transfer subunit [Azorhizobium oxalatiphilum]
MPAEDATAPNSTWRPTIVAEAGEVIRHEAVNAEYRHIVVACGPEAAAARPGQFFQLLCPQPPGEQPFLRRPMSVYGVDADAGTVEFLYKITGAGTRGLATLRVGDRLDVMGPLGVGFHLDPTWKQIVTVGRGAGLATLAPLIEAARANGTNVTAVVSARRLDLLVRSSRFPSHGVDVVEVTDEEQTSGPANVERILRRSIAEGRCDALFTCGSSRLLRVLQRLAVEFNLPGQVALEQQMACGIGLCYCCVRDFNVDGQIVSRRVCWDGPVFDIREALP